MGTANNTSSGMERICRVWLIASVASVPVETHVAAMGHTAWHQGPWCHHRHSWMRCAQQPRLEQRSETWMPAWKLRSWVREWGVPGVPGCSGQRRFNLDLIHSKDIADMYICIYVCTALSILLAETSHTHTHLSPRQSYNVVLSLCEIIPARLPKWKIQKLNSCLPSHSSVL